MANANEPTQSPMSAMLQTGYDTLDNVEQVTLLRYTRYILPLDGYNYFIRDTQAIPLVIQGSLHFSTDVNQRDDETIGINRILLTTEQEIQDLNTIALNAIYIGQTQNSEIRFAFSATGKYYKQANLWHYRGDAIYPVMYSQIIDNPSDPISLPQVVSNSLPIWLSLNSIQNQFSNTVLNFGSITTAPNLGDVLTTVPPSVNGQALSLSGNNLTVVVNTGQYADGDVVYDATQLTTSKVDGSIPYPSKSSAESVIQAALRGDLAANPGSLIDGNTIYFPQGGSKSYSVREV